MNTKICTKCKQEKELSDFHRHTSSKDGLHTWGKVCALQVRKNHYKKNRQANYDNNKKFYHRNKENAKKYLSTHPCVDCGETDIIVLEFDHIKGNKEFCISTKYRCRSWKRLLKEIDKCEVRCANCHRKRHYYASLAQSG